MGKWAAKWIGPSPDPRDDLGVFAFRCRIWVSGRTEQDKDVFEGYRYGTDTASPKLSRSLPVRISADNRYKLYVNGQMVAFGPQRGDVQHWFYDCFDLGPHLREGENELVALVWNFGRWAPMAQMSARTGFVFDLAGEQAPEWARPLTTPGAWEVARIPDWGFDMMHSDLGEFYIDIGPGEIIPVAETFLSPFERSSTKQSEAGMRPRRWSPPHMICDAEERGEQWGGTPWMLIPRSIPPMRYEARTAPPRIRRDWNDHREPAQIAVPLTLQPGQQVLLDYGELLCAYPRIVASGPEGATLTLTYAEALWDGNEKGNRDEVAGKEMRGYQDKLVLGPEPATFEPLWWRTYRYLLIEASEPQTTILSVDAVETGYPIQVESSFEADDPALKPIWDVAVRTVERCAGETYFDCPYYEQLQYVGDTRIQALIGYYLGRDRRLQRNAVETLGWSLMENGLTQSRYPSRQTQIIPPFSLWWVLMLYDQMLYDTVPLIGSDDDELGMLWHPRQTDGNTVIRAWESLVEGAEEHWEFADWVPEWRAGIPPGGMASTVHQLTAALATVVARTLNGNFTVRTPLERLAEHWSDTMSHVAQKIAGLTRASSDPEWHPSEHAEALFRVGQEMAGRRVSPWPAAELKRTKAAKCTFYFAYYKHLAMFAQPTPPRTNPSEPKPTRTNPSQSHHDYISELQPWKEMIEDGLTTFAETPEPTRSDCHAWSAHPILGFFQIVAGVTSVAPSWSKAKIEPRPGSLKRFDARIAHPDGELRVAFDSGKLAIDTPVPADLIWRGKTQLLEPGAHQI